MHEENLTAEQKQAVSILEDQFNEIVMVCDWIQKLNLLVLSEFFLHNTDSLRELIQNMDLPKTEKRQLLEIIVNYNTYQFHMELSEYLASDLKKNVNNIVDSVYH